MNRRHVPLLALLVAGAGALAWWLWSGGQERAIRSRLNSLEHLVNTTTTEGLGTLTHAVEIGSYFTSDVAIDFGEGSATAHGRETVVGMAARLQPRTAAFDVDLRDVSVTLTGNDTADVTLTAVFTRRSLTAGEQPEELMDARELALLMSRADGEWRIAKATVVETIK